MRQGCKRPHSGAKLKKTAKKGNPRGGERIDMRNTIGQALSVTLFGESHGAAVGAVIDGLAPGVKIDEEYIRRKMELRRPSGEISTARQEADAPEIVSGVYGGVTTGTPICIIIKNENARSGDYAELKDTPRPSHADYTAEMKYHGHQDPRGGGHFSGRITAALVAAGAIISSALESLGIEIGTHISYLHGIRDRALLGNVEDIRALNSKLFPVLKGEAESQMKIAIMDAKSCGDSLGGILETAVVGMPKGVGEPWFDTVEGTLSHILFSIPAVKGVEFGAGFGFADMTGSEANDPFRMVDGRIVTASNHNGGVLGGITNGMPIIFRTVIKPTPSISCPQDTVSLSRGENATISVGGRHDPAIIHRARAVIDAVTAIALGDLLTQRFGTDYLASGEMGK